MALDTATEGVLPTADELRLSGTAGGDAEDGTTEAIEEAEELTGLEEDAAELPPEGAGELIMEDL